MERILITETTCERETGRGRVENTDRLGLNGKGSVDSVISKCRSTIEHSLAIKALLLLKSV